MKKYYGIFAMSIIILLLALVPSVYAEKINQILVCENGVDIFIKDTQHSKNHHFGHGDTRGSCVVLEFSNIEIVESNAGETEKESNSVETGKESNSGETVKKSNCSDCTAPKFIDFQINNRTYTDLSFHTQMDLLKVAVNQTISLNMTLYESRINHIDVIQFSLVPQIRDSVNDGQGLIEFHLGWDNEIDEIIVSDMVKVISFDNKLVPCNNTECMQLSVEYFYKKAPENSVLNLNTFDVSHNTSSVYFNDGFEFPEEDIPIIKKTPIKIDYRTHPDEMKRQQQIAYDFMKSYYRQAQY